MGVFNKLKGIFYDEIVVDEKDDDVENSLNKLKNDKELSKPKVEKITFSSDKDDEDTKEEKVKKEQKQENTFSERELFRSERTFNFTEFDDEDEEEKLPNRKNILEVENKNRISKAVEEKKELEQPKIFKPSPIISPIYGILDKDYKKDEIKSKQTSNESIKSKVTTYDSVRRKAYGTLEDDLEDTLNSMNNISTDEINKSINHFSENNTSKKAKIEDLISKIEDVSDEIDKSMSIGEIEDKVKERNFEKENSSIEKTMTDSDLEHDLFNLIDSMYDDKEE